jgi:hypothetical protein
MKKISYRNSKKKQKILPDSDIIPIVGSSDNSSENAARSGMILTGLPDTHELPDEKMTTEHVGLIKDLVDTADDLDLLEMSVEADFFDFLIQKFAAKEIIIPSEEEKYIEYIYKIYTSDIPNSISKIEELSKNYSNRIVEGLARGLDKDSSKKSAFEIELLKNNIVKTSQHRVGDPKYVADEISKIIRVIISKMSIEAQNRARINLKNRILRLNINEMTTKQTPAGASIGTSIALIKNILNGRDGYFIKAVVEKLVGLL